MPVTLSETDQQLYDLTNAAAPTSIAGVITLMQSIDAILPNDDGLKWFNRLYLMVTQQVDLNPPNGAWQSPIWLTRLDVVFATLYFTAVADYLAQRALPSAWSALFQARTRTGVDRIQFALAGMNAHINHDLALALLATDSALNLTPGPASPEFADYNSVNQMLNELTPPTLTMLAVDTLGVLAQDTGKIGRLLSFWNICAARQLAWDFANHLRPLTGLTRQLALTNQDAMTGVIGRALLTPMA